jgi:hypothetical protein
MTHHLLQYDIVKLYLINEKPTAVFCVTATQIRVLRKLTGITRREIISEVVAEHDMRGCDTVEVQFHSFSTSALDGGLVVSYTPQSLHLRLRRSR